MILSQHQFQLFADYFQFYIQDELAEGVNGETWDKKSSEMHLGIAPGTIGIGTFRNMTVPVLLEIYDTQPDDDLAEWDIVNECSIEIPSGKLVIAGCTDYFPTAARVQVTPQCYRARVYYGGLETVEYEFGKGDDHYKIILWPAPYEKVRILK